MNRSTLLSLVATSFLAGTALAAPPDWEDQAVGDTFLVGDTITPSGVDAKFLCFAYTPPSGGTCSGLARIDPEDPACNTGNWIHLRNINLGLDYLGSIGAQNDPEYVFADYGGNINLEVNGDFRNFENMQMIHGASVGGCVVEVLSGGFGNDCGRLRINGVVEKLMIGGQEFWFDDVTEYEQEPCDGAFLDHNDLPFPQTYVAASWAGPFITGGVPVRLDPTRPVAWAETSTSLHACGDFVELVTHGAVARYQFIFTIGQVRDLEVLVNDLGGDVHLEVNGSGRVTASDWSALDGAMIGGCSVRVVYGGGENQCTRLRFQGLVRRIGLGGDEMAIDCMWADRIFRGSDFNADDRVNAADIGILLGLWGTEDGDLNGDGTTDSADIGILLGEWDG